jgi:SAM-dependent methyltransferase
MSDEARSGARGFFAEPSRYLRSDAHLVVRERALFELVGSVSGARVLDAGCGDGRLSRPLLERGNDVTFLDLSAEMLSLARARVSPEHEARAHFVEGPLERFEGEPAYDLVLCIGVLAHVPSLEVAMRALVSLVRPGGRCVVQLTDHGVLLGRAARSLSRLKARLRPVRDYELKETPREAIVRALEALGLRLVDERRYHVLLPGMSVVPAALARRALERAYGSPLARAHGAEVLLCLEKPAT